MLAEDVRRPDGVLGIEDAGDAGAGCKWIFVIHTRRTTGATESGIVRQCLNAPARVVTGSSQTVVAVDLLGDVAYQGPNGDVTYHWDGLTPAVDFNGPSTASLDVKVLTALSSADAGIPTRFLMRTRTTSIAVRGTAFTVSECSATGTSAPVDDIDVSEGDVDVQSGVTDVDVPAGKEDDVCNGCANPATACTTCAQVADAGFFEALRCVPICGQSLCLAPSDVCGPPSTVYCGTQADGGFVAIPCGDPGLIVCPGPAGDYICGGGEPNCGTSGNCCEILGEGGATACGLSGSGETMNVNPAYPYACP